MKRVFSIALTKSNSDRVYRYVVVADMAEAAIGRAKVAAPRKEMRSFVDRGYTVDKMKIGGASIDEDRQRIDAVLDEIGNEAQLAVDANGRFNLETAISYAHMLRQYPLFWYEEAGDPLDFSLQAALADFYPGPMATGPPSLAALMLRLCLNRYWLRHRSIT